MDTAIVLQSDRSEPDPHPPHRFPPKPTACSSDEVRLAALAISLNIRLRSADMPLPMQERAMRCSRSLLGSLPSPSHRRLNPATIARALKKEFDISYGPAWHCVVGKSFGSFVTHSPGGFLYFSLDSLCILLFKTEVHLFTQ